MSDDYDWDFAGADDAKLTIRAAIRYLLKGTTDGVRGDIVQEIVSIVRQVASGLPPQQSNSWFAWRIADGHEASLQAARMHPIEGLAGSSVNPSILRHASLMRGRHQLALANAAHHSCSAGQALRSDIVLVDESDAEPFAFAQVVCGGGAKAARTDDNSICLGDRDALPLNWTAVEGDHAAQRGYFTPLLRASGQGRVAPASSAGQTSD